ncbi:hypothetical protein J2Z17_003598 [Rhizobium halophytocola]|uniref:Uncharacterized protein n=1 Tax=Rhizobium halophytocola TaxID=735519 RepID=A0ABS4E2I0_9HYPH|nr:hypothetical protein [Rhizobium halophytocola]
MYNFTCKANYELHIRCENCMREASRIVSVPQVDDAPEDVEELLGSGLLANLRFKCSHCDSAIGRVFAVTR